jgi:hypothetical protein
LEDAYLLEGNVDIRNIDQTTGVEDRCGHAQHTYVDNPGDAHGDKDVDKLEAEYLPLLVLRLAHDPALGEG